MKKYNPEDIYLTLLGHMLKECAVPGVEDAFAEGGECDRLYSEAMDAYERLRTRLGARDEDPDVEIIINDLLSIQRILCEKMFHYGQFLR